MGAVSLRLVLISSSNLSSVVKLEELSARFFRKVCPRIDTATSVSTAQVYVHYTQVAPYICTKRREVKRSTVQYNAS
jgi:hypothetical protein